MTAVLCSFIEVNLHIEDRGIQRAAAAPRSSMLVESTSMNVYSGVAVGFGAKVPGSGAVQRCRCFLLSPVTCCPFLPDKKNSYTHVFDRRLHFPTRRVRQMVTFDSVSNPPPLPVIG